MCQVRRFLNSFCFGQSSLGLFILTVVGFVLVSLPLLTKIVYAENMNPERKDRLLITFQSIEFRDSLVSNVAVSIPVIAEFVLDIITNCFRLKNYKNTSANTGSYMRAQLPRFILVASLFIPGLLILCIVLPSNYPEMFLCVVACRLIAIFYGVLGHLWEEGGEFWRSPWIIFVMALLITAISLAVWDSISDSGVTDIRLIIGITLAYTVLVILIFFYIKWIILIFKIGLNRLSLSQISCSSYLIIVALLGVYIVTIVSADINSYSSYNALFFTAYTYVEGAFTVALVLVQGRLNRYEITMNQNILELKRNFVRFVSHEIRTPLNSVAMGLSLVKKGLHEGEDIQETLKTLDDIDSACGVSINILNDLLSYEKLEAGIMVLEKTDVTAWDFLSEATKPFVMQSRNMEITLELPTEEGNASSQYQYLHQTILHIDNNRMSQVIRNLVSNALKFSPKGSSVVITTEYITDRIVDKDGNSSGSSGKKIKLLRIQVKDQGAGIAKEDLHKLFNEIVQFNPGKLQNGGGSGFGLYLCKSIVELHGGRIFVTSEGEGHGCTFTLDIPIAIIKPVSIHNSTAIGNITSTNTSTTNHINLLCDNEDIVCTGIMSPRTVHPMLRVLVVDDATTNRKYLCRLLKDKYDVEDAEDGHIAVTSVRIAEEIEKPFHIILMDYQMPNMDGPTATKLIREMGYRGLIIGITGNALVSDVEYFISHGADRVLAKPVDVNELLRVIRDLLSKSNDL